MTECWKTNHLAMIVANQSFLIIIVIKQVPKPVKQLAKSTEESQKPWTLQIPKTDQYIIMIFL